MAKRFYIVDEEGKRLAVIVECDSGDGAYDFCRPDGTEVYCDLANCDFPDQTVADFFKRFLAPALGID